MIRLTRTNSLTIAALLVCCVASAQEDTDGVSSQVEQAAEELVEAVEVIGKKGEGMEQWAEQYSDRWERWAEGFEKRMELWAEDQERVWENWAERYSQRWEEWGQQLDSGELNSDEIGQLVERNLEMLSDMPIGHMVDSLMKEGVGELRDAPWESFNDLQDLLQNSLEQSLRSMEEMAANEGSGTRERLTKSSDEFDKALSKLRAGLDAKLKRLDEDADKRVKHLTELLASSELSEQQRDNIREVTETIKNAKTRRAAEIKQEVHDAQSRVAAAKGEQELQDIRGPLESAKAKKIRGSKKKLRKESATRRQKRRMSNSNVERGIDSFIDAAEKRKSVKSKESEIDALRQQIEELREEVELLRKHREGE